jgi:hypothetical protein
MKKLSLLTLCFAVGAALGALSLRAEDKPLVSNLSVGGTTSLPAIDHMVYLSFLPEPAELMKDAEAAGLKVLRLDKTSDKVVVSYQYPDGHTATLGYALLSSAGNGDRVSNRTQVTERVVVSTERDPEIVYVERPYRTNVIYRDYYDDFWPPLVLGLGLGWATSWHGGGHYYGGYHGGYHGGGHRH